MGLTGLGNIFLGLAFVAALVSIGALWIGTSQKKNEGEQLVNLGYLATFGVLAFMSFATALLLYAFLVGDYSFRYVAENHPTDVSSLSWLFKVSGVWAGREGSLLFWEFLLSIFAAFVAIKRLPVTDKLSNVALAVTNFIQIFFLSALFIATNNPFKAITVLADGTMQTAAGEIVGNVNAVAMNPLLQHWAMILHPPTLFIGYAGLAIPFAFAIAALIVGDGSKLWVELTARIAVFSWLFLGIGIGLGAVWAYVVLGWGGYWAWDPVENASLLPWLTGVGLLHSFTVYRRRDAFKGWAVVMATVTFVAVLLGTFITRSGIVQSVHAFEKDPLSFWLFLLMMLGSLAFGGFGLLVRKKEFASSTEFESLLSKEASYYFNNVLMLVSAFLVAYLTMAPSLPMWLPGGGQTFGVSVYDSVARPVGMLYILIMAVCPILVWGKTDPATFWNRARWPLGGAAVLGAVLLWITFTQLVPNGDAVTPVVTGEAVFGMLVAALAVAMPIWLFIDGARKKAAASKVSFGSALLSIMTKARTQSGGYLTHFGMGIILIGLIGSAMFVKDIKVQIPDTPGSKFEAGGYTFTLQGVKDTQLANGDAISGAQLGVSRGERQVGTLEPQVVSHAVNGQSTRNVDIVYEPLRDVFVIFEQSQGGQLFMNVKINPLISFVWVGFVLIILGTSLAVWPRKSLAEAA